MGLFLIWYLSASAIQLIAISKDANSVLQPYIPLKSMPTAVFYLSLAISCAIPVSMLWCWATTNTSRRTCCHPSWPPPAWVPRLNTLCHRSWAGGLLGYGWQGAGEVPRDVQGRRARQFSAGGSRPVHWRFRIRTNLKWFRNTRIWTCNEINW